MTSGPDPPAAAATQTTKDPAPTRATGSFRLRQHTGPGACRQRSGVGLAAVVGRLLLAVAALACTLAHRSLLGSTGRNGRPPGRVAAPGAMGSIIAQVRYPTRSECDLDHCWGKDLFKGHPLRCQRERKPGASVPQLAYGPPGRLHPLMSPRTWTKGSLTCTSSSSLCSPPSVATSSTWSPGRTDEPQRHDAGPTRGRRPRVCVRRRLHPRPRGRRRGRLLVGMERHGGRRTPRPRGRARPRRHGRRGGRAARA